jgi:hypothetical protein
MTAYWVMSVLAEGVSGDEKRDALDRVCQSRTFARSDRLRDLLRFVCTAAIDGKEEDLKEYTIGVEVLGRPPGYLPSEDSSVRSRAYELRRKLEKFYETEGSDATVRIVMPRGSYVPQFARIAAAPVLKAPAPAIRVYLAIAFLAGAALAVSATTVWRVTAARAEASAGWTPELEAIWKPMIESRSPILVSFQSRLFFRAGPLSVRDWRVDSTDAIERSEALLRVKQLFNLPQLYETRNYVDFGEANALFQLSKLLATKKQNIFARRSIDITWDDIKANNIVLIGKPEADPTIAHLLGQGKFQEVGGEIRNLQPARGEPAAWVDHSDPVNSANGWSEKYALITMMPGPNPGNWALTMSGSGSEHPWAIARYLTTPENGSDMVRQLRLPSGKLPKSYQVVIRAEFKAQAPVKISCVARRSLDTQ